MTITALNPAAEKALARLEGVGGRIAEQAALARLLDLDNAALLRVVSAAIQHERFADFDCHATGRVDRGLAEMLVEAEAVS